MTTIIDATLDGDTLSVLLNNANDVLIALDANRLQIKGKNNRWYDVRKNGQVQIGKRSPGRVSVPCKIGLHDCFRLDWTPDYHDGPTVYGHPLEVRIRPDNFDPRKRT